MPADGDGRVWTCPSLSRRVPASTPKTLRIPTSGASLVKRSCSCTWRWLPANSRVRANRWQEATRMYTDVLVRHGCGPQCMIRRSSCYESTRHVRPIKNARQPRIFWALCSRLLNRNDARCIRAGATLPPPNAHTLLIPAFTGGPWPTIL